MSEARFEGMLEESGHRAVVAVPFNPNDLWGTRQRHHVGGTVNGHPWHGPLEHDGRRFVLPLGPAWRRDNGLEVGMPVSVVLRPSGPLTENVAPDIAAALEGEPEARAFFESLAGFYRRNYVRWIEGAKRPATRAARIAEMLVLLAAGQKAR